MKNKSIDVNLKSISPLSFEVIKIGEKLRVEHKPAKINEYREKIGPARDCYLVFKGNTKIGMIPSDFCAENILYLKSKFCKVSSMNKEKSLISITLYSPDE